METLQSLLESVLDQDLIKVDFIKPIQMVAKEMYVEFPADKLDYLRDGLKDKLFQEINLKKQFKTKKVKNEDGKVLGDEWEPIVRIAEWVMSKPFNWLNKGMSAEKFTHSKTGDLICLSNDLFEGALGEILTDATDARYWKVRVYYSVYKNKPYYRVFLTHPNSAGQVTTAFVLRIILPKQYEINFNNG